MTEVSSADRLDPRVWLCVAVGLVERDGAILLVHQQGKNDAQPLWTLPGGVVEAGESLEEALHREVLEETGLRIDGASRLLWIVQVGQSLSFVFATASSDLSEPVHADPDGLVKEVAWVPRGEALELLAAHPFRRMREPLEEVLSGRRPEGSLWTYSFDGSTDHLVTVVPS